MKFRQDDPLIMKEKENWTWQAMGNNWENISPNMSGDRYVRLNVGVKLQPRTKASPLSWKEILTDEKRIIDRRSWHQLRKFFTYESVLAEYHLSSAVEIGLRDRGTFCAADFDDAPSDAGVLES